MSLLMQALKKAERAKQASLHEDELEKPSEAYDQVLELAPADTVLPSSRTATDAPPQALAGLSLEPLNGAPAAPPYQAPSAAAAPEASGAEPPRTETPRAETPRTSAARPRAASASRSTTPPRSAVSIDPATLRLAVLLSVLLLVVAAMGYWYWRATSSPGAGASLPGVPMPLTDAPGTVAGAGPLVILPATNGPVQPAQEPESAALREEEAPAASLAQQQAMIQSAVQAAVQAQLAQMPPAAPPTLAPVMAPPASHIQVMRNDAALQVAPGVQQGYQALSTGQLAPARQQYEAVLAQDPVNRDALLGLATVALREQQGAQAAALYVRLLELNPDDGVALAGLVGLRQGDLVQSEARLKAILERTPDSGPVLFALGNVYAKQRRWSEAQQQFFRAYSAVPDNPDYAFNLAVGLDRLNQPRLAASYYQRALSLAQAAPAGFDRTAAQVRLQELGGANTGTGAADIIITRQQ
ncbi:tetratricopeptide repeat protein [Janthinobacterium aquaticum]|uniref:tetratricopeptide repeat protein n=1 Tax=Janthinobacterium sp. FT58W TaxID=2654254 RepID=UPI001D0046AA|nr:tetratricopeptide repeat protein [Janthinobacterium sp. FT58W]